YQEILTDPSYCGQIVTMTDPHMGNYGVNPDDIESDRIQVAGFVVREGSDNPSNYRSQQSLPDYLRAQNIVGIQGIDTRALTRVIRDEGAMNGILSSVDLDPDSLLEKVRQAPTMTGQDLAQVVSRKSPEKWSFDSGKARYKVVALDFGIKHNILRQLAGHGCEITILPVQTTAADILALNPDGIFLSNGPGDPEPVTYAIDAVKKLLGQKPIFGICLGHQIMALALGAKTYKMKFGHRGGNHPVKNLLTGKVEITAQNHGFAVDADTLPADVEVTHWNLNDNTLEGFRCTDIPAFSVQYHPESSPGPHDSRYLFEDFIRLMDEYA
ncbi:MAG: glutamine-hydrolyzing carbamoyl-phosphate synthase small subunit, partial [Candidatus Marinimicrobia bacterium]|nr:glutamine-hydrolyzing carbamoyl-phosphate synthase small subunit [Candidatus Neomarinimicrobiota bacterium]MCF7840396.1 glutamine-hydrolyzing carbamoyl-phosphate synthase small subunit [Candidatus Neomarinimicrobiota bacterium]